MQYRHVLTIDFETFYSTDEKYSLQRRDMTCESYINDHRFQVILAAVKVDDGPAVWKDAADPDFEDWLRSFPWEESAALAHNGAFFDFPILSWVYGILPKVYLDTLLMARPLAGQKESNSLAALAERYGLRAKGTEVHNANGKRRKDFSPAQLRAYGEYCALDGDLCYELMEILIPRWTVMALGWMHCTARMNAQPKIVLDRTALREGIAYEAEREGKQIEALEEQMMYSQIRLPRDNKGVEIPLRKVLGSADHFANLLRGFGLEPPTKFSEKQNKYVYAFAKTDDLIRETQENGHEVPGVTEAVLARLGVKSTIMSTRLARVDGIAERLGMMPIPLKPYGTATGRCAGAEKMNAQNFSSRVSASNPLGKGNALRRALAVPDGHFMADSDESQVEVRMLGALTGETAIMDSFSDPSHDPYCIFGGKLYGREIIKGVDKRERDVAKSAVLGNGFGQGKNGFAAYCKRSGLTVSDDEAQMAVDVYRATHPKVVDFWAACDWALDMIAAGREVSFGHNGCLRTIKDGILLPSGRVIYYRGLQWSTRPHRYKEGRTEQVRTYYDPQKYARRMLYGSLVCENVVQGTAADITQDSAVILGFKYDIWAALQVHDSLVFVEPYHRQNFVADIVPRVMSTSPAWMPWIKLASEIEFGTNYGNLK